MTFPPEILQLSTMLDDPDDEVALNLLAQLLAREDELGELPGILQESSEPLVRRRAHALQSAITMRRQRREISQELSSETAPDVFAVLTGLHLLWFDKDQPGDIRRDVNNFRQEAAKYPLDSLNDAELLMRRLCILPENETTVRPENYCIGSVLYHRAGATGILMTIIRELLGGENFRTVRVMGEFGVMDDSGHLLLGNGSWRLVDSPEKDVEVWSTSRMLKYIAVTLLSCAVNSDSYRYVMSITQALTGDESEEIFAGFPYPFNRNTAL